ncbi:MAG: hypothetical protein ACOCRO_09775 [Halanaerobiales bacterium]
MKKEEKSRWLAVAIVLLVATVINIFVVDPIPFIDEVLMIAATIFSFKRSL